MNEFELRFFFDGVTGICLWADNEATIEKYDYPIFTQELPIPAATVELGLGLADRFAAFSEANWCWPEPDTADKFRSDVRLFLTLLREGLPSNFTVRDESGYGV